METLEKIDIDLQNMIYKKLRFLHINKKIEIPPNVIHTLSCFDIFRPASQIAAFQNRAFTTVLTDMRVLKELNLIIDSKPVKTKIYKMVDGVSKLLCEVDYDEKSDSVVFRDGIVPTSPKTFPEQSERESERVSEDGTSKDLNDESTDGSPDAGKDDAQGKSRTV